MEEVVILGKTYPINTFSKQFKQVFGDYYYKKKEEVGYAFPSSLTYELVEKLIKNKFINK